MRARRFCRNSFEREYKPTIGVDFEVEKLLVLDLPFRVQMYVALRLSFSLSLSSLSLSSLFTLSHTLRCREKEPTARAHVRRLVAHLHCQLLPFSIALFVFSSYFATLNLLLEYCVYGVISSDSWNYGESNFLNPFKSH